MKFRGYILHAFRVAIFAAIILLIHQQHRQNLETVDQSIAVMLEHVLPFYPTAALLDDEESDASVSVLDSAGELLGRVIQSSPQSDSIIGFSGPTNTMIAFDNDDKICGWKILSSQDTRDHVEQVRSDTRFLRSPHGRTADELSTSMDIDAVSGATLTSLAMWEGMVRRLGGTQQSLKFPESPSLAEAQAFFPNAKAITPDESVSSIWNVLDERRGILGAVLPTSPVADNTIGYQGPTNTLIFLREGKIIGVTVGNSYDNLPYVDYVREDTHFNNRFNGMYLVNLAQLDLTEAGIEGVSGATMTSMAVAEGIIKAANEFQASIIPSPNLLSSLSQLNVHDFGTIAVILAGTLIGLTALRANKLLRIAFQLLVIIYLGFMAGNLLSQAMLVGWAQHGVPWQSAAGLAILSFAALVLPLATRRNLYCTHLCPHGAAQQLLMPRRTRQTRLPRALKAVLQLIPAMLLAWCLLVAMTTLGFSLVDIEPFDAYVIRIAGIATISIAVVGLIASCFVPMAYCRYGCPTGAVLNFFRFNARSDRWTVRDWSALGLLLLAVVLRLA